jgi:glycosyltransferase involved in cell wall biosynthesis
MRHTLAALRVLVVMNDPPLPEGGAASKCGVALLRGLIARGVDVHALTPWGPLREAPKPPPDLRAEVLRVPPPSLSRTRADWFISPGAAVRRGLFADRLRELAAGADVVHFFDTSTAAAARLVDRPAVVQVHYATRRDRRIAPPWRYEGRVAVELLRLERAACRRADWLLANSTEVARSLAARAHHARVTVAPLALDPELYRPLATLDAPVAGLIGTAVWPPTARAVRRLLTRVWPLVRRARPDARLLLAGRGMERATFEQLPEDPSVQWCGRVDSAADFLRGIGVLLYPLTSGSGMKVKVLEALALGVPVVTTRDGAEGLGARDGVNVEGDDAALADATVRLLDDDAARRRAGVAAHRTFCEHHAPVPAALPVVELYERMTA